MESALTSHVLAHPPQQKNDKFVRLSEDLCTGPQVIADDFETIKALGVKSIVNLREEHEAGFFGDAKAFEAAGFAYKHLPVPGSGPGGGKFNEKQTDALLGALDPLPKPTLVFCRSGKRASVVGQAHTETRKGAHAAEVHAPDVAQVPADDPMRGFLKVYVQKKIERLLTRPGILKVSDALYIAAQPTEEELKRASAAGIKSVLNLRGADEVGRLGLGVMAREADICAGAKLAYKQIGVDGTPTPQQLEQVRAALDALPAPVLVHCAMRARAEKVAAAVKHSDDAQPPASKKAKND